MSDFSLRLARPGDADAMPAIEHAASSLFSLDPELAKLDLEDGWGPDELRSLIHKGHCLVAHRNETMVGFLVTEPFRRELHIWEMDVHPSQQGMGIGAALLRACQIDARNSGFAALTLTTFRDLPWNAPFYQKLGFVEVEDLDSHQRLSEILGEEAQAGLPRERRCAMICFLD